MVVDVVVLCVSVVVVLVAVVVVVVVVVAVEEAVVEILVEVWSFAMRSAIPLYFFYFFCRRNPNAKSGNDVDPNRSLRHDSVRSSPPLQASSFRKRKGKRC